MRRLLVTGGAGFIGSNFVHHWARTHPNDTITVLDALTYAGNRATLERLEQSDQITFVRGDITDSELVGQVMESADITVIAHFAAESHVDRSIADPGMFIHTNVVGTQILLDACRRAWFRDGAWRQGVRFHHVSTDEVYGSLEPNSPSFTETTPYSPNSPYAASKAGSDHLVRAYAHTYGLPVSISNCSNNYGPYHFPEKLIPLMIVNALDGKPLPVYGDGQQVRDWLFVEDHCVAIETILLGDVSGQTFNVGGNEEQSNIAIVERVCELLDQRFAENPELATRFTNCPAANCLSCSSLITYVADRPGHDRRYAVNATRIASALGFRPRETLATGIMKTIDWYLANEDWWRAVMDGSYRNWLHTNYSGRERVR